MSPYMKELERLISYKSIKAKFSHMGNMEELNFDEEVSELAFNTTYSANVVKMSIPNLSRIFLPLTRPMFKVSPEVVFDKLFKVRLEREMLEWQQVRDRGLAVMKWWEIIVKPGIRRLAILRTMELNKYKRSRMNFRQEICSDLPNSKRFREKYWSGMTVKVGRLYFSLELMMSSSQRKFVSTIMNSMLSTVKSQQS